jgi:hypothetical protein
MGNDNRIYEVLKQLRPYDIDIPKVRIGGFTDGGYVMADNMTPDQVVLSYGLGGEISFDLEMAEKGHACFMFDHTIAGLNASHPNFHYHPEGVAGESRPDKALFTVKEHLDRFGIAGSRLILKMDVEGAEWDAMGRMPDEVLERFEQIALEVHEIGSIREPAFLDKALAVLERINKRFTLFHVHANNNNPMETAGGFPVYNLLELSYVKTDVVSRSPSRTLYPTEWDYPNEQDRDDYVLSAFPFWPQGLSDAEYGEHARVCKARNDAIVGATLSYQAAMEHLRTPDIAAAEASLRDSLARVPNHGSASIELVRILNERATGHYNDRRFGEAAGLFREMRVLLPDHPGIRENLVACINAQR